MSIASTESEWPKIVEPTSYQELEQFASGTVCPEAETLVIDGLSYAADSIIKDYALTVSRTQGNSGKRAMGIPELDDYGTIGELTRRLLARILMQDKHILVTAWQANYQPPDGNKPEKFGSVDLSGAMRSGAPALFDVVMRLNMKRALRNPKDANSAYYERFWQTEGDSKYICKSRISNGRKPIFPAEVPFDLDKGTGTFQWFLDEALKAYNGNGTHQGRQAS